MKNYPENPNGWIYDIMIVIALVIVLFSVMLIVSSYTRRAEKAAYLEGRFDLDHATAWHMAGEEGR